MTPALTASIREARRSLRADYDRAVDVLYFFTGKPVPVEGGGLPGGVEIDYAIGSGAAVGATVVGYARNGWHAKVSELAQIIAEHLSVDPQRSKRAIEQAVSDEGGPLSEIRG